MSNDIVKVRLLYNNKTTSVELDASRSVELIKPFLRALWESMDEPPIRLISPHECKVELCGVEHNKPSNPVEMHLNVCPKRLNNKDNCLYFYDGECIFYRTTLNDDTKRLCAYQSHPGANS